MAPDTSERLLELVGDVQGLLDLGELHEGLMAALDRAVPSDWVSLNDVGPGPDAVVVIVRPEAPAHLLEPFARYAHQNPLAQHMARTRDGRPLRFSDVVTRKELEALDLYREVYAVLGVHHQIAFTLPHETSARLLGVALSRRESDYSDAERDLLARARPFLIQAYRNAIAYTALRDGVTGDGDVLLKALATQGLTEREAQIVRLVALGGSSREVGDRLGISDRTVQKHLQRSFAKLGVGTRAAAAARAWELAVAAG